MEHRCTSRPPRIRTRSLKGSSVDDYLESITKVRRNSKKIPPRERVLTRRFSRLSGDRGDVKLSTFELPFVRRRRRHFSKQNSEKSNSSCQRESQAEDNLTGNNLVTKATGLNKSQKAACDSNNGGPKRTSRKLIDIFYKKPPGKHRRRRRQPTLPIKRTVTDYEVALPKEVVDKSSKISSVDDCSGDTKNCQNSAAFSKGGTVASVGHSLTTELGSEISVGEYQTEAQSTVTEGIGIESGYRDDCTIVKNEAINLVEVDRDKNLCSVEPDGVNSNEDTNEGTDSDIHAKSQFLIDENSCSVIASNDGDSRDSTEYEASIKCGSASVNTFDSDGSSYSSTENPAKRQRSKSDHGYPQRPGIDFRVGGRLEARDYLNMWYPSRVIQVDWEDKEVLIHFERWNSRFDEWVSMDSTRLRAITRTSARKEKRDYPFPVPKVYKVGEIVLAKWTDCKMYPAKIVKFNSDMSYNVLFYDGYESVVQCINIRKLPPELVGNVNFKNVPSLKPNEKNRCTPVSKPDENAKPKTQAKKLSPERIRNVSLKSKEKSSTGSGQKSSTLTLGNKRRKLVVGGIFQAKRHNASLTGSSSALNTSCGDSPGKNKGENVVPIVKDSPSAPIDNSSDNNIAEVASVSKKEIDIPIQPPTASHESSKGNLSTADVDCDDAELEFTSKRKRLSSGVARKQFVIEEDHNHFKCLVDGCGKAFRKDVLLASHMKHYHRTVTKRAPPRKNSAEEVKEADDKRESTEGIRLVEAPKEQLVQPIIKEGNLERKLITEKRRQLLFQRKLERRHQQAAMALQAKNALKKAPVLSENNTENAGEASKPDKPKTNPKKKKFLLESKGIVTKVKKRKMESEDNASAFPNQEINGECTDIQSSPVDSTFNSGVEPVDIKPVLKGKRRRRLEHVSSSDGSEKSISTSVSDDDKNNRARPGKGFSRCGNGRKIKKPFYEWGDGEREEVVNCRCLLQEEDGLMMQCEVCLAWQHGTCFDIEEEDKVPEKYVCFACENPKGLRKSFKYRHNQDWFKLGELATFRFLLKHENSRLKDNTFRSHNLASQILSIGQVLHTLQYKLQIARKPTRSSLALWSHSWLDNMKSETVNRKENEKVGRSILCDPQPGHLGEWAFSDHSYSAPNRIYHESEFVDHTGTFLSESCDDKHLCMEVAANEVLDVQGSGPPVQDGILDFDLVNPKQEISGENPEINDITDSASEDVSSETVDGRQSIVNNSLSIKKEALSHKAIPDLKSDIYEADVVGSCDVNADKIEDSSTYMKMSKYKCRPGLKCNNSESETLDVIDQYSCRLNLLNHIEHLQEELDRRLDDLTLQLESLESEYESQTSNSDDGVTDIPHAKRLLKAMTNDLLKVQRMALYC